MDLVKFILKFITSTTKAMKMAVARNHLCLMILISSQIQTKCAKTRLLLIDIESTKPISHKRFHQDYDIPREALKKLHGTKQSPTHQYDRSYDHERNRGNKA